MTLFTYKWYLICVTLFACVTSHGGKWLSIGRGGYTDGVWNKATQAKDTEGKSHLSQKITQSVVVHATDSHKMCLYTHPHTIF